MDDAKDPGKKRSPKTNIKTNIYSVIGSYILGEQERIITGRFEIYKAEPTHKIISARWNIKGGLVDTVNECLDKKSQCLTRTYRIEGKIENISDMLYISFMESPIKDNKLLFSRVFKEGISISGKYAGIISRIDVDESEKIMLDKSLDTMECMNTINEKIFYNQADFIMELRKVKKTFRYKKKAQEFLHKIDYEINPN